MINPLDGVIIVAIEDRCPPSGAREARIEADKLACIAWPFSARAAGANMSDTASTAAIRYPVSATISYAACTLVGIALNSVTQLYPSCCRKLP